MRAFAVAVVLIGCAPVPTKYTEPSAPNERVAVPSAAVARAETEPHFAPMDDASQVYWTKNGMYARSETRFVRFDEATGTVVAELPLDRGDRVDVTAGAIAVRRGGTYALKDPNSFASLGNASRLTPIGNAPPPLAVPGGRALAFVEPPENGPNLVVFTDGRRVEVPGAAKEFRAAYLLATQKLLVDGADGYRLFDLGNGGVRFGAPFSIVRFASGPRSLFTVSDDNGHLIHRRLDLKTGDLQTLKLPCDASEFIPSPNETRALIRCKDDALLVELDTATPPQATFRKYAFPCDFPMDRALNSAWIDDNTLQKGCGGSRAVIDATTGRYSCADDRKIASEFIDFDRMGHFRYGAVHAARLPACANVDPPIGAVLAPNGQERLEIQPAGPSSTGASGSAHRANMVDGVRRW